MYKEFLCVFAFLGLAQSMAARSSARIMTTTRFLLYTQTEPFTPVVIDTDDSITSNFVPDKKVIIYVHGHEDSPSTINSINLKFEILSDEDVNVVFVDWTEAASSTLEMASMVVPSIGQNLASFIGLLNDTEFPQSNIHLIGFDLGAHICGFAGRARGGEVQYITGLNPSGIGWRSNPSRRPLTTSDAQRVEVIHTGNHFGIDEPIGHVDFFVNGGRTQPGCANHNCHRDRAVLLMMASIRNTITGTQCETLALARTGPCFGRPIALGSLEVPKLAAGIFRVNTPPNYPYTA